jgi:hypothetical protein
MSKKKNVIARVGNFEIHKESGPEYDYLRIKAVNGHWAIMYRDDNEMYGKMLAMVKDKSYADTLEHTIVYLYTFTNMLVDVEFVNDFAKAVHAMQERVAASQPAPTEQEETDAIAEVQMMEEIKKNLSE